MLKGSVSLALALTSFALTACRTAPDLPSPKTEIMQLGYVDLREARSAGGSTRDASASFERVDKVQNGIPADEGCSIFASDKTPEFSIPDLIDAGPDVTLSTRGQPYAVLEKIETFDGNVFYQTGGGALFSNLPPIPPRLEVTIPGGAFPAFNNVVMPPLPPAFVVENLVDTAPLTIESRLVWTPSAPTDDVRSSVGFTAFLFGDVSYALVQCSTADDGEFTFTGEVREILSEIQLIDGLFTEFVRRFERVEIGEAGNSTARLVVSTSTTTE